MNLLPIECEFCFFQTNALPSNFPYNLVPKGPFILTFRYVFKEYEILRLTEEREAVSLRIMTSLRTKQQEPVPGKCGI